MNAAELPIFGKSRYWVVPLFFLYSVTLLSCGGDDSSSCAGVESEKYFQTPVIVSGGPSLSNPAVYTEELNERYTLVAFPEGSEPAEGWDYVVMFYFMSQDGTSENGSQTYIYDNWQCLPEDESRKQQLLHALLEEGYAVILTGMWAQDSLFYKECDSTDPSDLCWFEDNPDKLYWQELFELVRTDTLVPGENFNYDAMAVAGFSVGAQMVSRMFNEFQTLETSQGAAFPQVDAGAMVAGGSLGCYQYLDKPKDEFFYDNFTPCVDPFMGCCPHMLSEPFYDDEASNWPDHPAVALFQYGNDEFADPLASVFYHQVMLDNDVPVTLFRTPGVYHGLDRAGIPTAVDFFNTHVE